MLGQESDGTANLCPVLFHFAYSFGEAFNIAVCKVDSAKTDAMSGKVKFIDEIVVAIKFFIFDITVFFDRRFGISRLSAVSAVLRAVAATDICEQLDIYPVAFVFRS